MITLSSSEDAKFLIDSQYHKINAPNEFKFIRPNLHSPIFCSRLGALKHFSYFYLIKNRQLEHLKYHRRYGLYPMYDHESWQVFIENTNAKTLHLEGSLLDMSEDIELLYGEFLRTVSDDIKMSYLDMLPQR